MKKIGIILIVLIILFGCASTEEPNDTTADTSSEAANQAAEEKEPVREEVTVKVPIIISEISYPDATAETRKNYFTLKQTFTFADNSTDPVTQSVVDYDGNVIGTSEYLYNNDGQLERMNSYDREGTLNSYWVYEYTAGYLTAERLFNRNDEPQSAYEYEYDSLGKKTRWETFIAESLQDYAEYVYDGEILQEVQHFKVDGNLVESYKYEYSNGMLIAKKQILADGSAGSAFIYEYDGKYAVLVKSLRENGSVEWQASFEYNADGFPVREVIMDAAGDIEEIIIREFIYREETMYADEMKPYILYFYE